VNSLAIIEKYYEPQSLLYAILVKHSNAVTQKALEIAENHPEMPLDKTFIQEAAMVHDIGIFLTNAPRISCFGSFPYICHGYLGADLIRKEGFPKHALVCERHTGAGISLFDIEQQNLPLPKRDLRPVSLEEQLICFADKFYSKTRLDEELTLSQVQVSLSKFGGKAVIQFQTWCELFL